MNKFFFFLIYVFSFFYLSAQTDLDEIVAIVGDEIILNSDIQQQSLQFGQSEDIICEIYKDLMFQKILINQAKIDSIQVSENEVTLEVENRINYFITQLGSIKNIENYYNKDIDEIKKQLFDQIQDQFFVQRMQYKITNRVNVSPVDVIDFYNNLPKDSLPIIEGSIEFAQIVMSPEVNDIEELRIKNILNEYKDRINNGDDFTLLAALYSQDINTSSKGGNLGFVNREDMIPEFNSFVYAMDEGEISNVIKSSSGYHIVKLISRSGQKLELSHILLKPNYNKNDIQKLKFKLDSIKLNIEMDSLLFGKAAYLYSEDISKNNNGFVVNPNTGSTKHAFSEVLYSDLLSMSDGDISDVKEVYDGYNNIIAMKILQVVKITDKHVLDLEQDYVQLYEVVSSQKKNEKLLEWIKSKKKDFFIKINNNLGCNQLL